MFDQLLDEQNALRNKLVLLEDSIKTMHFDIDQVQMDQNSHHLQHSEEESNIQREIELLKKFAAECQVNEWLKQRNINADLHHQRLFNYNGHEQSNTPMIHQ